MYLKYNNIFMNFLQDVIFAIPEAFYEAASLQLEAERFLESCDFIGGSLGSVTIKSHDYHMMFMSCYCPGKARLMRYFV